MKVKALRNYYDLELSKHIKKDEEYEVSAARGKELTTENNKAGCVLCEEVAAPGKAVKKTKAKKEE